MASNFTSKNISSISLENIIYNLKSVPFHATAAEWELAPLNAYVPKQGEIVIYDKDENHDYIRVKIGDGINNPSNLDFYSNSWNDLKDKPFDEEQPLDEKYIPNSIARINDIPASTLVQIITWEADD